MTVKKTWVKKCLCILVSFFMLISVVSPLVSTGADSTYKVYGIDVSKWQADIDWCKVKADGINFVIMRVGSSSKVTGGEIDSMFEQNYAGAKFAKLNVGAYFYSCARTTAEAEAEAENVKEWLKGKRFEYPIYIDMEDASQLDLTTKQRTDICIAFNTVLEKAGYMTGVYANTNWFTNYLDKDVLSSMYSIWEARWMRSGTDSSDLRSSCNMWQYTNTGSVAGIKGDVDLDVSYVDYATYVKTEGLNGFYEKTRGDTVRGIYKTSDNLNMRSEPGVSSNRILTIPKGKQVSVLETNSDGSWAKISYDGKLGWVGSGYLILVRYFNYTVSYDNNHPDASGSVAPVTIWHYGLAIVGSSEVKVGDTAPLGWSLHRSSDDSWFVWNVGWVADKDIDSYQKAVYYTEGFIAFDDLVINRSVGDDSFTFCAEWPVSVNYKGTGYYSVVRDSELHADSPAGNVILTVPAGSMVPLTSSASSNTYGYVSYNGVSGYVSLGALEYIRPFKYTAAYDLNGFDAENIPDKEVAVNSEFKVSGALSVSGTKELEGWNLMRESDGAWYTADGIWTIGGDSSDKACFAPEDILTLSESFINKSAGDDRFIFTAVWKDSVLLGDVNGDGEINTADILILRKYFVGLVSSERINFANADINCDGEINSADIIALRKYFVGIVD